MSAAPPLPAFVPNDYKTDLKPVWCPGCGDFGVLTALYRAMAEARGEKVAAFVPEMISPFPVKAFEEFLASVKSLLVIEVSFAAQFTKYLRTFTTLPEDTRIFKRSGGKNLGIGEVDEEIRKFFSPERRKVSA